MRGLVELGNPGGHCGAAGPTTDLASRPRDTAGLDTAQGAIATPLVGGAIAAGIQTEMADLCSFGWP